MSKQDRVLERIGEIDSSDFEDFTVDLWEKQGYDVETAEKEQWVTLKATNSGGFFKSGETLAVQPLFNSEGELVDKSDMNRILEIRWEDEIEEIVVVTNTDFDTKARKKGNRESITLVDGEDLAEIVLENNATNLVNKYGMAPISLTWLVFVLPLKLLWLCIWIPMKLFWIVFIKTPLKIIF